MRTQEPVWRRKRQWRDEFGVPLDDRVSADLTRHLIRHGLLSITVFTLNRAFLLGANKDPKEPCRRCGAAEETFHHLFYQCEETGFRRWKAEYGDEGSTVVKCLWWGLFPRGNEFQPWMKDAALEAARRRARALPNATRVTTPEGDGIHEFRSFRGALGAHEYRRGVG